MVIIADVGTNIELDSKAAINRIKVSGTTAAIRIETFVHPKCQIQTASSDDSRRLQEPARSGHDCDFMLFLFFLQQALCHAFFDAVDLEVGGHVHCAAPVE